MEGDTLHEIVVRRITYKFLKLVLMNENIFFTYYVHVRGYGNLRKLRFKIRENILLYFSVKVCFSPFLHKALCTGCCKKKLELAV